MGFAWLCFAVSVRSGFAVAWLCWVRFGLKKGMKYAGL
jgi:hypothetical protein